MVGRLLPVQERGIGSGVGWRCSGNEAFDRPCRVAKVAEVMAMTVSQPDHHGDVPTPAEPPVDQTSDRHDPAEPTVAGGPPTSADRSVPRTRWGAAWVGICAAALALVALIVFMLQNTRPVEVSFLWLHGTLPLALALLIAGVGSVIVAMVFGVARITQLRKLARRRNKPTPPPTG